jgi:hypothetical protein
VCEKSLFQGIELENGKIKAGLPVECSKDFDSAGIFTGLSWLIVLRIPYSVFRSFLIHNLAKPEPNKFDK